MSYNIDTVKLKKLENFTIPLDSFYSAKINKNWLPKLPVLINDDREISIQMGCGQEIRGTLKDGIVTVSRMLLAGEGSGHNLEEVLSLAFKDSKGYYEAVMIWEGGDSVTSYIVDNGVITEKNIDF